MNKKMHEPDGVVVETRTCGVHILVEDSLPDGIPRVSVEVVSRAHPDDKQVQFRLVDAGKQGYAQIIATEDAEAPPKRKPDPVIPGMEIAGDLQDKYVVLVQKFYPGALKDRVIHCTGGFGCTEPTRKLFGKYVKTGKDFAGRRESAWRFATDEEVAAAQPREKVLR
jgi:hypothetical protein